MSGAKRAIAQRGDAEQFQRQHLPIGTFAAPINENPTTPAERLMAFGLRPVAGPDIDGMLVHVFRRSDLEAFDVGRLKDLGRYPTGTGRKPANDPAASAGERKYVSAGENAATLGIAATDAHKLLRKDLMQSPSDGHHRCVRVTLESLRQLQYPLRRTDTMGLEEAASRFGITATVLLSVWAAAGVSAVQDLILWRRVALTDVEKLERLRAEHSTAQEAGKLLGMHRSHLPNLERRGPISTVVIGERQKLRLHRKSDFRGALERSGSLLFA